MKAGFTVMTLRQSNSPLNGKGETGEEHVHNYLGIKVVIMCEDFALPFSPGNFLPKTTLLSSPSHPTCLTWPFATFLFP
jgi:hypothetical protein